MSAFREAIAREVRRVMLDPEFTSRQSKNGGRIFWVKKAAATDFAKFVKEHPAYEDGKAAVYTTMSEAAAAVVADRGDEVRVTEGHTEEFEKVFCLATAGVRWVGEGQGTKVPTITVSGAIHGVALTGAGVEFENFRFAAPPITGALDMIRIKAAGCKVKNIYGRAGGPTTAFVDCITIIAGANDFVLEDIKLGTDVNAPAKAVTSFLTFEGDLSRGYAAGLDFEGSVSGSGILDDASVNIEDVRFERVKVIVFGPASKAAVTLDSTGSKGSVKDAFFAGTQTTLADNARFEDGWRLSDVKVLEETGSTAQAALTPAVDTD